jgi:two-component system chemotaxis response regulator CheY
MKNTTDFSDLCVLIVDDSLFIRKLFSRFFNILGLGRCFAAGTDREAIEIAKTMKPDVITLDLTMPGEGGEALIEDLKEHSPESRVCVISALNYHKKREELRQKGAFGFLGKPVELAELKNMLLKVQQHKRNPESVSFSTDPDEFKELLDEFPEKCSFTSSRYGNPK